MSSDDRKAEKWQTEHEKWRQESTLRAREVSVKEREQATRELELKTRDHAGSSWRNPLVIAIVAAAVAAAGNAIVVVVNGFLQRQLEDRRAEQSLILEVIKTDNADMGAENLDFLLRVGLVADPNLREKLDGYLAEREPGSGPTLPAQQPFSVIGQQGRYLCLVAMISNLELQLQAITQTQLQSANVGTSLRNLLKSVEQEDRAPLLSTIRTWEELTKDLQVQATAVEAQLASLRAELNGLQRIIGREVRTDFELIP